MSYFGNFLRNLCFNLARYFSVAGKNFLDNLKIRKNVFMKFMMFTGKVFQRLIWLCIWVSHYYLLEFKSHFGIQDQKSYHQSVMGHSIRRLADNNVSNVDSGLLHGVSEENKGLQYSNFLLEKTFQFGGKLIIKTQDVLKSCKTFHLRRELNKTQDVITGGETSYLAGEHTSCSGSKQLKNFSESQKLTMFTRPLPLQAEKSSHLKEVETR